MNRREFLGALGAATAAAGCTCPFACGRMGRPAVQLYSIREYIGGKRLPGKKFGGAWDGSGVGLAKAIEDVAKIGYEAVEFAGYYDCANDPKKLKKYLDDAGIKACGTHVNRLTFAPEEIEKTIEFNLAYGNTHLICPGSGMWPSADYLKTKTFDDWWKEMTEFFAKAAETANRYGCTLGYHNHTDEFVKRTAMKDGTIMWDYFFSNTPHNVCMEQDVGWTTCAGYDPCYWFKRFPGRSPTLHAKENAGYLDANQKRQSVADFDGVLGKPGRFPDGKTVKPVDWDALAAGADAAGVKWWVVECEKNASNLNAIKGSFDFLKAKGRV